MRKTFAFGFVMLLAVAPGCATILGSKTKDLELNSNPQGADVYVNGNRVGASPAKYQVPNNKPVTVVFKMAGYKDTSCTLTPKTGGGWVIFDVLTGLVPIVIDAVTGAWSQLDTNACTVTLDAAPAAAGGQ